MRHRTQQRILSILLIIAVIWLIISYCTGCSGLSYRPTEQKPFVITDPNTALIFDRLDVIAESIKPFTEQVEKIIESPVVDAVLPKPVKQGLYFIGANIIAVAGWYLNKRKNLFKNGFSEMAMANELIYANGGDKKIIMDAESKAINPPTLKLMRAEGFKRRVLNE